MWTKSVRAVSVEWLNASLICYVGVAMNGHVWEKSETAFQSVHTVWKSCHSRTYIFT